MARATLFTDRLLNMHGLTISVCKSQTEMIKETIQLFVKAGYSYVFKFNLSQTLILSNFIPVRSDESRVFTCFLEYEKETVKVHDIIYERNGAGWDLKKSFYRKTRVPLDWTKTELEKEGFAVEFSNRDKGLITIIARR